MFFRVILAAYVIIFYTIPIVLTMTFNVIQDSICYFKEQVMDKCGCCYNLLTGSIA